MNLNFLHTKEKGKDGMNSFLDTFIKEIKQTLNKNQTLVIDRIEENFVVCEKQSDRKMINIPRDLVSDDAIEGMMIKLHENKYIIDYQNCIVTRKNIIEELKNVWKREEGAEYYIVSSVLEKAVKCSNIYMKQNIYVKDERLIKNIKKGDIVKVIDGKYIIDKEKTEEVNKKVTELEMKKES